MLGTRVELGLERALLRWTWRAVPASHLAEYLVGGYQSPLINVQSIIARHHFVKLIAGDSFSDLERGELEFAVGKHRSLREEQRRRGITPGQNQPGVDDAFAAVMGDEGTEFLDRWRRRLDGFNGNRISVIEAACGSANDYGFLAASGIADHLDYRGFDLTAANISNARAAHPGVDFRIGDVLAIDAAEASFDWVVVHDLFEHLGPAARVQAVKEVCRVARAGIIISFFNMADIEEHDIRPHRAYHWNRLSRDETRREFLAHSRSVDAIHVARYVQQEFGFKHYYNKRAYTFIVHK